MEFKVLKAQASRRDVIKGALKGAAYAAPVVAASSLPMLAGAATGPFGQSLFVNGVESVGAEVGSTLTFSGRGYVAGETIYLRFLALTTMAMTTTSTVVGAGGTFSAVVSTVGFPIGPITATAYRQFPVMNLMATPLVSLNFTLTGGPSTSLAPFPSPPDIVRG